MYTWNREYYCPTTLSSIGVQVFGWMQMQFNFYSWLYSKIGSFEFFFLQ